MSRSGPRRAILAGGLRHKIGHIIGDLAAHLCQLKIFAQPLARSHQIAGQKRLPLAVTPARQAHQRAFHRRWARTPCALKITQIPRRSTLHRAAHISKAKGRIFASCGQGPQGRAPRIGNKIARHAPRRIRAGNPVLQRNRLGNIAVNHGCAQLFTISCFAHDHRRFHLSGHRHHSTGFTKPQQYPLGFLIDPRLCQVFARAGLPFQACDLHSLGFLFDSAKSR